MFRALMTGLVLLLITLTAAHLGKDEQFLHALGISRLGEQPSSSRAAAPAQSVPVEPVPPQPEQTPPAPDAEKSDVSPSASGAEPAPRFVLDEPLPDLPPLSDFSGPFDPSAAEKTAPDASSDEGYIIRSPTEEETLATAEPYVREMYALVERTDRLYKELSLEALRDYLAIAPDRREEQLSALVDRYAPRFSELERKSDDEAGRILARMTASLAAVGANDRLAQDARAAFEGEKEKRLERYGQMFTNLSGESAEEGGMPVASGA